MKCCRPHWKSQGKVREFDLVWRVVTLYFVFLWDFVSWLFSFGCQYQYK